ncbi:sodium transport system permease protein [Caldicellulosiruptor bescii]|uniref:ABC-type Na+ efflux pump permease component-like protein n=2 Tax=Caldicellulosiruptor bescii TaxID=31899 RepID=B9MLR2_CALBD|nr:ABC transporter permease [Caldicellulosiruptor bescii]ACM59270.1 ABC-type Na+ efflux pump permease component-like protein [Caldicellulosiruptor bescii DSM 6725]PBC88273.1 sodium transport system permease protein [Caldicellulosiruptor bescii]PBC92246.1 sodium transport system permease protein [Caldicellulosiruptor bescii]PBD04945.1 sodium transport system permease protein [Caldicellulosiruptor bescii]PBD05425.1 sodium transport system permease protein [Caldicellulosiruptor bescii]
MKINMKHVWIVFKKELKDAFRDRRALFMNFILPILTTPLIFLVIIYASKSAFEVKPEKTKICIIGEQYAKQLVDIIKSSQFDIVQSSNPKKDLQDGKIKAVIEIPQNFLDHLSKEKQVNIKILVDGSDSKSSNVGSILNEIISNFAKNITKQRLLAKNINPEIIEPIVIIKENVAPPRKMALFLLAILVPMFVVLNTSLGGMNAAIDITAGEKERGTLEPLLTTAASRISLVTGKYISVSIMAIISGVTSLIGLGLTFWLLPLVLGKDATKELGDIAALALPASVYFVMFIVVVLTAIIFSAVEVAIASYARSFKEAQTYLTPITFLVLIPAYFTMYKTPNDLVDSYFIIPLINSLAIFKELIYGIINIQHLLLFIVSSTVYLVASIIFASKMFENEKVLFRS